MMEIVPSCVKIKRLSLAEVLIGRERDILKVFSRAIAEKYLFLTLCLEFAVEYL